YTCQPYTTATTVSKSALGYAEPLRRRFAPLLPTASLRGRVRQCWAWCGAVESRYPYPFKTTPEDIVKDLKARSNNAKDLANKTIEARVKSLVANVAEGIDQMRISYVPAIMPCLTPGPLQRFALIRAYALSRELSDQLRTYSTRQLNQLKTHNMLVKRASKTAHDLSTIARATTPPNERYAPVLPMHTLSNTMLTELHPVRATTTALPAHAQAAFSDISHQLSSTISDLTTILKSGRERRVEE
ncbi:uncharacterized protein C8Q71DRAFT_708411, partial [Rhodofomes roseus]